MADWASRTASSVSPLPTASCAWDSRDSTVTGASGAAGLGCLAEAAIAPEDRALAETSRAARTGIRRDVMGRNISHFAPPKPCAIWPSAAPETGAIKAVGPGQGRAGAEVLGQARRRVCSINFGPDLAQ